MRDEYVLGMENLKKTMQKLEKVPQKQITKAARQGAKIILLKARENAPVKTKLMQKGIYLKGERPRKRGKKVFQITFRSKPEFVKITKDGKRYFYPASQEFGFDTVDGGHVDGKHYLQEAMETEKSQAALKMIKVLDEEIKKAWEEGKLK